jgi:hypothetical protein
MVIFVRHYEIPEKEITVFCPAVCALRPVANGKDKYGTGAFFVRLHF